MTPQVIRYFHARKPPVPGTAFKIPFGAPVRVIRFYPKRRALVEYRGEEILTFATLLRKDKPCSD
jgi:hypothetical protein